MKNPRTFIAVMVASSFLLASAIGVAAARTGGHSESGLPPVKVSALHKPFHATRRQRRELSRIRRQMFGAPRASIAASANVPDARPVALPQGLGNAWVSEAEDGAVCTFIPDPQGGYGASCATQADLRQGGAVTVLGGGGELSDEAIAVIVVPDGGQDPVVTDPDGSQANQHVDGIGSTVLPESSRISVGAVSLEVPVFNPHCSSNPNDDFRRCGL